VEKQQRKMIDELRDKLAQTEAAAVSKSEKALRDAEKYTAQAAQMQAKFSQQQNLIQDLRTKLAQAEEDRREKHGELQRLEQQLLEELNDLKLKGVQTSAPSAPSADPGMVAELRRQVDSKNSELDRMRQDLERLRRQPAPAAGGGASQADLDNARREIESLKQQLAAAKSAQAPAASGPSQADLDAANKKIADLQQQLQAAQSKAAAPAAPAAPLGDGEKDKEIHRLQNEVQKLQARVKQLEDELAADDLKAMISDFAHGTQSDLEQEVADLRTKNVMLEQELEDLRAAVAKK